MNEQQRLAYLEAMGVELHAPRFVLPAAAPSVVPDLTESIPPPIPVQREPFLPQSAPAVDIAELRSQLPDIEPPPASRGAEKDSVIESDDVSKQEIPSFTLLVSRNDSGLMVVDQFNANGDTKAYQALLANLLFAVTGKRPSRFETDRFIWPMTRQAQVDQSEQAARSTLSAYLGRQCGDCGGSAVLVLGDAARWLYGEDYQSGAESVVGADETLALSTVSVWAMLEDAEKKRIAWSELQPLVKRFRSDA